MVNRKRATREKEIKNSRKQFLEKNIKNPAEKCSRWRAMSNRPDRLLINIFNVVRQDGSSHPKDVNTFTTAINLKNIVTYDKTTDC